MDYSEFLEVQKLRLGGEGDISGCGGYWRLVIDLLVPVALAGAYLAVVLISSKP